MAGTVAHGTADAVRTQVVPEQIVSMRLDGPPGLAVWVREVETPRLIGPMPRPYAEWVAARRLNPVDFVVGVAEGQGGAYEFCLPGVELPRLLRGVEPPQP